MTCNTSLSHAEMVFMLDIDRWMSQSPPTGPTNQKPVFNQTANQIAGQGDSPRPTDNYQTEFKLLEENINHFLCIHNSDSDIQHTT